MIETSGPTHQHASPHITDNYSFRSLRVPIVRGAPRVSDTLWGSPIFPPTMSFYRSNSPYRCVPFVYLSSTRACFLHSRSSVALVSSSGRIPLILYLRMEKGQRRRKMDRGVRKGERDVTRVE